MPRLTVALLCIMLVLLIRACGMVVPDVRQLDAQLAQWKLDSARVADAAKAVPLDSFSAVTVALSKSPDSDVLLQARACERFRLEWKHGDDPVLYAVARWQDTFFRSHPEVASGLHSAREDHEVSVGIRLCGLPDSSVAADARGAPRASLRPPDFGPLGNVITRLRRK